MNRERWLAVAVLLAACAAVAVLGSTGWSASAYRDGDFTQFWVEPRALVEGGDPYEAAWWAAAHERVGQRPENPQAVYPPHDAIAFLPLALLPLPYAAAAWIVGQALAVAVAVGLLATRILPRAGRGLFVALCVSFQPVWLLVVGANVTGFLFAAVAGAFVAVSERRLFLGGALLGLLVVKPHPFAFLVIALVVRATWPERRSLGVGALSTAVPLVAIALALRPGWYVEWLRSALTLASSPRSNATVWTLDHVAGLPSWSSAVVAAGALLAFAVWQLWTRPNLATTFAGAIPVSLMLAPYGWSYDHLHLLIPIAVALAAAARRTVVVAPVALGVTIVPWALYVLAFRRGGEEVSVVMPLLVLALLMGSPRRVSCALRPTSP